MPRRPAQKKQNPVRPRRTGRTAAPDIRTVPGKGSVCTAGPDIGAALNCPAAPDISRLPLPAEAERLVRGSSTARAPAQAGDAGSSPAPVACLTAYVLSVGNAELDRLEELCARRP